MVPGDSRTTLSAPHCAAFSSASRRTEVSPLTSLPCHFPWGILGCFASDRCTTTTSPVQPWHGDPAERSGRVGRDWELQLLLKYCCRLLGMGVTIPWTRLCLLVEPWWKGDGLVVFLEEERGDQALAGVRMSPWHLLRALCPRLAHSKPLV